MTTSATEDALAVTRQQIGAYEQQLAEIEGQLADVQRQRDLVAGQLSSAKELEATLVASLS